MSAFTPSSASSAASFALLPHEIHLAIIDCLEDKTTDLCSLRATCRAFDQWYICQRLFQNIHFTVSFDEHSMAALTDNAINAKNALKFVDSVTVKEDYAYTGPNADSKHLNDALERIFAQFPDNRIRSFRYVLKQVPRVLLLMMASWACHEGLGNRPLSKLVQRQFQTLEHFTVTSFRDVANSVQLLQYLTSLTSFDYHKIASDIILSERGLLAAVIHGNQYTLHSLSLGADDSNSKEEVSNTFPRFDCLVRQHETESEASANTPQVADVSFPALETLSVRGLGMNHYTNLLAQQIRKPAGPRLVRWDKLQSLSLMSCHGSRRFLECMAQYFAEVKLGEVALKTFNFQHENPNDRLCTWLRRFLASFSGLKHISVVLDKVHKGVKMVRPHSFIVAHGSTLRTIVWDGRYTDTEPNLVAMIIENLRRNTDLSAMSTFYPNIEELSMPFFFCHRKWNTKLPMCVAEMSSLKVLHNRAPWISIRSRSGNNSEGAAQRWVITAEYNRMHLEPSLHSIFIGRPTKSDYWMFPMLERRPKEGISQTPELHCFQECLFQASKNLAPK
jgi:hypothetical protein